MKGRRRSWTSFTASDKTLYNVVVAATPTGDRITELTLESDAYVSLNSIVSKWYKFTPKETGKYQLYSTSLEKHMWFEIYSDKQYRNSDYHYLTFSIKTLDISLGLFWLDDQDDFVFGIEKVE